jgi:cytochrome c biogenesis protein
VNHPASYKGIEIYQSSFDDGGSAVTLQALPLAVGTAAFEVQGTIGTSTRLAQGTGGDPLSLEFTSLRTINVENFGNNEEASGADVRKVDLRQSIDARMGAANKTKSNKDLRNIGPSIGYKLRDAAGQAREFHNYMLPVDMGDGAPPVFLFGVREKPSDPFRYLRLPVDDAGRDQRFPASARSVVQPHGSCARQCVRRTSRRRSIQAARICLAQLAQSTSRALTLVCRSHG